MVPSVRTMTNTTMKTPTKAEEIAILRDAVNKLGSNSYCGPWLAQQLGSIEQDIRSDYPVSADIRAAQREAQQILENAQARAGEIRAEAEKHAQASRDRAIQEANAIRANLRHALEAAAAKL